MLFVRETFRPSLISEIAALKLKCAYGFITGYNVLEEAPRRVAQAAARPRTNRGVHDICEQRNYVSKKVKVAVESAI